MRLYGALTTVCLSTLGTSLVTVTPSHADPTIIDVRDRVDTLFHQAEQASERVNDARIRVAKAKVQLRKLRADLAREREEYQSVRGQVVATVQAQVEGQMLTTASQLVLADDPDAFIQQMTTVDEYTVRQSQLAQSAADQAQRLATRKAAAAKIVAGLQKDHAGLVADKAKIEAKAAKAKALLNRLVEERKAERAAAAARAAQAARASRAAARVPASSPAPTASSTSSSSSPSTF